MEYQRIIQKLGRFIFFLSALPLLSCAQSHPDTNNNKTIKEMKQAKKVIEVANKATDTASFAASCFRCVEEQFKQMRWCFISNPSFTGSTVANRGFKDVYKGTTEEAEACKSVSLDFKQHVYKGK